jgi:hypothetical protein
MTRMLETEVPAAIQQALDGSGVSEAEGTVYVLAVQREDGWPHLSMLSVGELLLVDPCTIRTALWPGSTSTRLLTETGQATMAVVQGGAAYYLRCEARRGDDILFPSGTRKLAYFELDVVEVRKDEVPYAELTSGITYRLKDPASVAERRQEIIETLRNLGG